MTTYADLVTGAAEQIRIGAHELRHEQLLVCRRGALRDR